MKRPLWQYLVALVVSVIAGVAIYRVANQLGEAVVDELEGDDE